MRLALIQTLLCLTLSILGVQGAILFRADLRPEFVVPKNGAPSPAGTSEAWGTAVFELDLLLGAPRMRYEITFTNVDVVSQITGIHLHFGHSPTISSLNKFLIISGGPIARHEQANGPNGPHLLNIYGLPREDDADLIVDAANNRLSGVWDNSDENYGEDGVRDPGDSVGLGAAIDTLFVDEVYIQVHTKAFPAPNTGELRGQLIQVPEPSVLGFLGVSLLGLVFGRRR